MNKQFVKLNESRLRISVIKKYLPYQEKQLNIYFNTSRYKIEVETFKFETKEERDNIVKQLDLIFGVC